MIGTLLLKIDKLTDNKKKIYITGLIIAFSITLIEVVQSSYYNFQIFTFGSHDFWSGINPYSHWDHLSLQGKPLDVFLYSPQFSILFTPFTELPLWCGVFCWNLFTYTLFYFSVFSLPDQFTFFKKKFIFLYPFLLLLQTLFSEQFNPVVAALFLFSFTLLEKNKGFWAVFLIFLSGFTKVYGIFQIGILICYPKLWKNIFYVYLIGLAFLLLPLIKIPWNELINYYLSWIKIVINHSSNTLRFDTIYRPFYILCNSVEPIKGLISLVVLVLLYLTVFYKLKLFQASFLYRAQFLGILMVWAILFGTASERNTYQIAIVGYALWFQCSYHNKAEKILLWMNFLLLEIIPIDLFCPRQVATFLLDKLNCGIVVLTVTWCFMVYRTFILNSNRAFDNPFKNENAVI